MVKWEVKLNGWRKKLLGQINIPRPGFNLAGSFIKYGASKSWPVFRKKMAASHGLVEFRKATAEFQYLIELKGRDPSNSGNLLRPARLKSGLGEKCV
jgi:hypothetical protein